MVSQQFDRDLTGYHTLAQQAHHHQHGRGPGPGGWGGWGGAWPRAGRGCVRAYYIGGAPIPPPYSTVRVWRKKGGSSGGRPLYRLHTPLRATPQTYLSRKPYTRKTGGTIPRKPF